MLDLRSLSLDDVYRCSADLRDIGERAVDTDDAAERVTSYLFEQLVGETGAPGCPLVRLFRGRRLSSLDAADAEAVTRALGAAAGPSTICLKLAASRGIEPPWNDPAASRAHGVLPLASAAALAKMPMIAALVSQLGIGPAWTSDEPRARTDHVQPFEVFYVEHARGSPCLPAQAEFIEPYGIESVVGIGGVLPPSEPFVVLLFSRVPVARATAELFRMLVPSVGLALLPRSHDPKTIQLRCQTYELIVHYHESMALRHHRELERVTAELSKSLEDKRRSSEERDRLLARAQQAQSEVEAASRAKDQFLATLGHELRNPLSPILMAVELMKLRGDESRERAIIERQAHHLRRLVDDLLDVSRIGSGKLEVKKAPIELAAAVDQAVEIALPMIEDRSQRLTVDVPREGLVVHGDLGRLSQVVANMLDNASKFSDPGAEIAVIAERLGPQLCLRVRDQGAGISPDQLGRIFGAFAQQPADDRSPAGLGLGLAIVRSLVELHGGRVYARSEGRGKGSEFVVELPAMVTEELEAPPPSSATGPVPRPCPQGPRRVLVVDDNRDAANTLADALTELGHDVRVAHDGPSALEIAPAFRPDVALLDIGLPEMDGYELAERLRGLAGVGDDLRLIAITGYGHERDRERAMNAGFAEHFVKPIALEGLMQAVSAQAPPPR